MGQFDIADDLLSGTFPTTPPDATPGQFDIADELLQPSFGATLATAPIETQEVPTGEVSTITGEPVTRFDPEAPETPSLSTLTKAALVKDFETKKSIFAEARGLPVERFGVRDGKVIFVDDRGIVRPEQGSDIPFKRLQEFTAETIGQPAILGATVGSLGGPPGAAAGALAGETTRQVIAGLVFDDPQTAFGNLGRLGSEGLLALVTEFGGRQVIKAANKVLGIGRPSGRKVARAAGADIFNIDFGEAGRVKQLAKDKFGIDLNIAQSTKSKQLASKLNLLRDLPQSADIVQAADVLQNEQIQGAIPRAIQELTGDFQPGATIGREVKEAATKSLKVLDKARSKIAKPYYEFAFRNQKPVDASGAVSFLDGEIDKSRGTIKATLLKARKSFDVQPATKKEPSAILDVTGKPAVPAETIPAQLDDTLAGLQGTKQSITEMIDNLKAEGLGKQSRRILSITNDLLKDAMHNTNPALRNADTVFAILSPRADRIKGGLLGILEGRSEKDLRNISTLLLASNKTDSSIVKEIKKRIVSQENGQEIWDGAVGDYLTNVFENIKDLRTGGVKNIGGEFRQKIFGNIRQKKILKEALGDKGFKNLSSFMDVLQRTGITAGGESTTATRQEALNILKREFESDLLTVVTTPLRTPQKLLGDRINELRFGRGAKQLAEVLLDKNSFAQLEGLKQLKPRSETLIRAFTNFLGFEVAAQTETPIKQVIGQVPDQQPQEQ